MSDFVLIEDIKVEKDAGDFLKTLFDSKQCVAHSSIFIWDILTQVSSPAGISCNEIRVTIVIKKTKNPVQSVH